MYHEPTENAREVIPLNTSISLIFHGSSMVTVEWSEMEIRLLAYAESYGFLGIAIVAPPPQIYY